MTARFYGKRVRMRDARVDQWAVIDRERPGLVLVCRDLEHCDRLVRSLESRATGVGDWRWERFAPEPERRRIDWTSVLAAVIVAAGIIALFAVIIGVKLLLAGGDWGCVFAQDTTLCVAVKGAGR